MNKFFNFTNLLIPVRVIVDPGHTLLNGKSANHTAKYINHHPHLGEAEPPISIALCYLMLGGNRYVQRKTWGN